MTSAISSGAPSRLTGFLVGEVTSASSSAASGAVMSLGQLVQYGARTRVSTKPGATLLHRIPSDAYSIAAALAMPTTACFEATYAAFWFMPTNPVMDAIFTIDPRCRRLAVGLHQRTQRTTHPLLYSCLSIWASCSRIQKKRPRSLIPVTLSH